MLLQLKRLPGQPRLSASPQTVADGLLDLLPLGDGDLVNQNPNLNLREGENKLGPLHGLYSNVTTAKFNPDWIIPDHKKIRLSPSMPSFIPSRVWSYLLPARFWPKVTRWLPPSRGVKDYYPGFHHEHKLLVLNYLDKLFHTGVLYKRHSGHHWEIAPDIEPYPWEQLVPQPKKNGEQVITTASAVGPPGQTPKSTPRKRVVPYNSTSFSTNEESGESSASSLESINQSPPGNHTPPHVQGVSPPSPSSSRHRRTTYVPKRVQQGLKRQTTQPQTRQTFIQEGNKSPSSSNHETSPSNRSDAGNRHDSVHPSIRVERHSGLSNCITNGGTGPERQADTPSGNDSEHHQSHERTVGRHEVPRHGLGSQHLVRATGFIPDRITGGVFLVDKNSNDTTKCRLVVDFSQFSRSPNAKFPKYRVPNLSNLQATIPLHSVRISLDLSEAFYHIPIHPGSARHLLVSDALGTVYGFRKTPMGVGLSPFLLHLFTSALATWIRSYYPVHCIAYMDDFLLSAPQCIDLSAVCSNIICTFQGWGIHINFDKSTPAPVASLRFLGYELSATFIRPHAKALRTTDILLKNCTTGVAYDYKVIQRLVGHLCWIAPFTKLSYMCLRPLYNAITMKHDFVFGVAYLALLRSNFGNIWRKPLRPFRRFPSVYTDASDSMGAAVSASNKVLFQIQLPTELPIHVKELVSLLTARRLFANSTSCLATDSMFVCYQKFSTLPFLFALKATLELSRNQLAYVHTSVNPADAPSRGLPYRSFMQPVLPLPVPRHPPPWFLPRMRLRPLRRRHRTLIRFLTP
uniref:Protein P n=1 Tax=Australasian snapper hepatitis B virus TaxID=2486219 RepID=A0A3G4R7K7_9HEPA|nr:RNA-dependent RNA-polymerase [Australasian snapper hepatitis B virus]